MHLIAPAETRLKEVVEYFSSPGLKDRKTFGATATKKAELRRSLNQIITREVVDAHTGLGILATYENSLDQAIEHFRIAYNFSNKDDISSLNYANSLFLNGRHNEAFPVYKNAIEKNPTSVDMFREICRALIGFCYLEELNEIAQCVKSKEDPYSPEYKKEIELNLNTLSFLKKINVDVGLFRKYQMAIDRVFFKYFNITTSFETEIYYDDERSILTFSLNLPISDVSKKHEDLLGDMNDELQDEIIRLRKSNDPVLREKIKEMSNGLCFYFSLPDSYGDELNNVC
ncbi:hypothetical protein M5F04_01570 [Acinetobacter sp. ANC 7200]|uniref:hypothetical protein n=1 Tax=Acinetobacter amyesii TaxID=2942470 RepID=UPI0020BE614A|nr:hypothetical protein [Acinetobacter amyesii]MCL6243265.1 hypothetical protein [Acinetobacter amyesii]